MPLTIPAKEEITESLKIVFFRVPPMLHKRIKRKALDLDKTLQEFCTEAVEQYLETQ